MISFDHYQLDDGHCFLCGASLTDETRSVEHVFPDWLQRTLSLRNERLNLLNGTSIPYRQLVIPCCIECNNVPLADMENDVSKLLLGPFRQPNSHEETRLFQWCSKILYGLMYREMSLRGDLKDPKASAIMPREFMEGRATFHHFMTSIRRPFEFIGFVPYSIFAIETLVLDNARSSFDFRDFVLFDDEGEFRFVGVLAIRVQHFGIICIPNDWGQQKRHFQSLYDRFHDTPLSPIQFLELAVSAAYKHSLLKFTPLYNSFAGDMTDSPVIVQPAICPIGEIWAPWDNKRFAEIFATAARSWDPNAPSFEFFFQDGKVRSYLYDENGDPSIG